MATKPVTALRKKLYEKLIFSTIQNVNGKLKAAGFWVGCLQMSSLSYSRNLLLEPRSSNRLVNEAYGSRIKGLVLDKFKIDLLLETLE